MADRYQYRVLTITRMMLENWVSKERIHEVGELRGANENGQMRLALNHKDDEAQNTVIVVKAVPFKQSHE